jgi:hypothetical protein
VSANFQTTLKLDIATATTTAGAAVTGADDSGIFSIDLGDVNGLGIGTPASNVTITAVSGGFTYTTPIKLTPVFTGFTNSVATITVGQDASDDANSKNAAREGAAAATVAVLPAIASARVVTTTAASDTAFERFIGVFVTTGNGGVAVAGARTMNLVYTITVP